MKPQFILAVKASMFDKIETKHGLNSMSLETFALVAQENLIIGQREALEKDPTYRQIIPYICLVTANEAGQTLFYPYVRTSMSGEDRLKGNVSVGFGGHIDLIDVVHGESVIDLVDTIGQAALRELSEEVDLSGGGEESSVDMFDGGLLLDHSNEVGKVHLGVVLTAVLPNAIVPTSKEDALEVLPPMTARELLDSGLPLENWTILVLKGVLEEGEAE